MKPYILSVFLAALVACGTAEQQAATPAAEEPAKEETCTLISEDKENDSSVWLCKFETTTCKAYMSGETVYALADCVKNEEIENDF